MARPKFKTGKGDLNHMIVRDFLRDTGGGFEVHREDLGAFTCYTANLRGKHVWAIDTSKLGGVFLDWLIGCADNGRMRMIEVKTPEAYAADDHDLRPGETWSVIHLGACTIVSTDEQVADAFMALIS